MVTPQLLAAGFAANQEAIKHEIDGLTHADSLRQPPFRGNCLNWVLGHIVASRDNVLRSLGAEPVLAEAEFARYRAGSPPVTGEAPGVVRLQRLLQSLDLTQERIAAALQRATPESLAQEVQFGSRRTTVAEAVFHRFRHDSYHTGQLEYLRPLAGKGD